MKKAHRTIDAVLNEPWAASTETVEKVWTVVNRFGDPEALRAKLGKLPDNTRRTQLRDGVALISVLGPLVRYADMMAEVSGATSYATLAKEIDMALDNPEVKTIILEFNSGGGTVTSCSELASHLQGKIGYLDNKQIIAYVDGQCCSAAYWIASSCSKVYASNTAIVGSIGVQMLAYVDEQEEGEFKFLSSHSPNKNAPVSSKEGRQERQRIVDDLGEVFVEAVAQNRGITKEEVLNNYGQGSVFVAADALNRGMIDEITTLEELMAKTVEENKNKNQEVLNTQKKAFDEGKASVDLEALRKEVATEQITRIKSILSIGATVPAYLMECINDPKASDKDAAYALWKSQQETKLTTQEDEESQAQKYLTKVAAASEKIRVDPQVVEKPKDKKQETKDAIDDIASYLG